MTSVVSEFRYAFRGEFGDYEPIYTTCPEIIFLLGPPGSGKSTVGKKLAERDGKLFISTGDLYRQEKEAGTEVYKFLDKVAKGMKDKKYTPDDYKNCLNTFLVDAIIDKLVKEDLFLGMSQQFKRGIIIDGFRGSGDFEELIEYLPAVQHRCIYLDAPEAVLVKRLQQRDRDDDNERGVEKRVRIFNKIYGKKIREDCKKLKMWINYHREMPVDAILAKEQ